MVKRTAIILMLVLSISIIFCAPVMAEQKVYDYLKIVRLIVGQKDAEINYQPAAMDQAAYVKDGRTLVPFRFLGESLGAKISWDEAKKQAKLNLGEVEVISIVGSKTAYVNGRMTQMDVPAETKGGRIFVPLRFVSENLGASVYYDDESKEITLSYTDKSTWKEFIAPVTEFKYKYPPDWEVTTEEEGLLVIFTSPQGSKMGTFLDSAKPSEFAAHQKKVAEEYGWDLDVDSFDDPDDPEAGGYLEFSVFDPTSNAYQTNIIYYDPFKADKIMTFVSDQIFFSEDIIEMDNIVMLDITYS